MITVHAVDVSGSITNFQLIKSKEEVKKRFRPGDKIVLFDYYYKIVTDFDRPFDSYFTDTFGRGGTYAGNVLDYAETLNAHTILYSDGFLSESDLKKFKEIIIINYE